MAKWVLSAKRADFNLLSVKFNISPVIARIIRNRDIISLDEFDKYLNGDLSKLNDPSSMLDMVKACSLMREYINENRKIRIIGDYDIDGVCSTYILYRGLTECGADVDYAIPHRIHDGYGLNESLVQSAYDDGREIIITCDNGIAAIEQIDFAYSLGMHVIVTDHHEVPFELEEDGITKLEKLVAAEAIVDPKREGDNYPFDGICGAVVAWKFIQMLLKMANIEKAKADKLILELMEEAAIATVGDVMELKDENRIIVKEGLARINNTENIGLKALIRAVGLSDKQITAYHIGFVIGPCINATGRLDAATRALELLLCKNPDTAAIIANELKNLNDARKDMTELGVNQAIADIESSSLRDDRVLVIYLPDIHESLAGIIAGRIRERYEKPTIVMTDAESGIKGSGRSVEAYDMFAELSKHKELFTKFGGHRQAAGLSMSEDNLDIFRKSINEDCTLTKEDLICKVTIDIELPFAYVTEDLIEELSLLEPFGNGNSKPVFAQRDLPVISAKVIGKKKNLLLIKVADKNNRIFELKIFNKTDVFMNEIDQLYGEGTSGDLVEGSASGVKIDVIYYPGINEFNGRRSLEFIVNDYRFRS